MSSEIIFFSSSRVYVPFFSYVWPVSEAEQVKQW